MSDLPTFHIIERALLEALRDHLLDTIQDVDDHDENVRLRDLFYKTDRTLAFDPELPGTFHEHAYVSSTEVHAMCPNTAAHADRAHYLTLTIRHGWGTASIEQECPACGTKVQIFGFQGMAFTNRKAE